MAVIFTFVLTLITCFAVYLFFLSTWVKRMNVFSRLGSSSVVGIGGTSSSVPFKFLA